MVICHYTNSWTPGGRSPAPSDPRGLCCCRTERGLLRTAAGDGSWPGHGAVPGEILRKTWGNLGKVLKH